MDKRYFLITTRDYPGQDRQESDSWVKIDDFQSFLKRIAGQIDIENEINKYKQYDGFKIDDDVKFELAMHKLFNHDNAAWTKEANAYKNEILCYKRTFNNYVLLVMPCTGNNCLPDGVRECYLGNCVRLISKQFSINESNLVILAHSKDVGWSSTNPGFVGRQDIKQYDALGLNIDSYHIYAYHHYGDVYNDIVYPVCHGDRDPKFDEQKFFNVNTTNKSTGNKALWDKMKELNGIIEL